MTLAVRGGRVWRGGTLERADVLIDGERVAAIGEIGGADAELDAGGCLVIPAGLDCHTHALEGLPDATDAALRSGVTRIEAYAPPQPGERVEDACARWIERLGRGVACDVELLATVYEPELLDERSFAALAELGVRGIKLFLAYRELGMECDDGVVMRALEWGARHGVVPRLHCENGGAIDVLRAGLIARGETGVAAHPRSRPPLVEEEAVRRALDLTRLAGASVYIVHVSTRGAVEAIREALAEGIAVVAETCPQYLMLDESVYLGDRPERFVSSPPMRSSEHVEAVWEGLADGTLTRIGSDHGHRAPRCGLPFHELVSGFPGIAARTPLLLSNERLGLADAIRYACDSAQLSVGGDADLALWDPSAAWTLTAETLGEGIASSPWEGALARGRVRAVLLRGEVVVRDGLLLARRGRYRSAR